MCVFMGIFSKTVSENLLGDACTCHAIEMGCGGMPEQMGMEMFMDIATIGNIAKDILQGSRGDAFSPF